MKLCKLYDIPEVVLTLGFSSSTPTPDQDLTFNIYKAVGNLVHQGWAADSPARFEVQPSEIACHLFDNGFSFVFAFYETCGPALRFLYLRLPHLLFRRDPTQSCSTPFEVLRVFCTRSL